MADMSTEQLLSAYGYTVTASIYVNETADVAVFKALDQSCGQPVVLKVTYATRDYFRKVNDLLSEAMAQRSLDHPNICRILRVFIFERGIVIALEPLRQDLSSLISERRKQPFAETEAWTLLRTMASALEFAQRKGVSHRDIKPQNILISQDGVYKLCDFGSAKEVDLISSQLHSLVGSPLFLSPQLRLRMFENTQGRYSNKAAYNPFKSDVYSLALTLLYFICLAPPKELVTLDNLSAVTAKLLASLSVSAALKEVLSHMLQPDEAFRPDFTQLKQILDAQPVQPAPVLSPVQVQASEARSPQSTLLPRLREGTLRCHCTNPLPGNYFITSCGHACCSKKCYEALSHVSPCPICPRSNY